MTSQDLGALIFSIICFSLILFPPFFWIRQYINEKRWQKVSPVINQPKELHFGKATFVRNVFKYEDVLKTPVSRIPYAVVYHLKEPLTEDEDKFFRDGLYEYYYVGRSFCEKLPELGLVYTSIKCKNDWLFYDNGKLVIVNVVNFRLNVKEGKKTYKQQLKEFWGK